MFRCLLYVDTSFCHEDQKYLRYDVSLRFKQGTQAFRLVIANCEGGPCFAAESINYFPRTHTHLGVSRFTVATTVCARSSAQDHTEEH
jgi:hypothetical protein